MILLNCIFNHSLRYHTPLKKISSFGIFRFYLLLKYEKLTPSRMHWIFKNITCTCYIIIQQICWNTCPLRVDGTVWVQKLNTVGDQKKKKKITHQTKWLQLNSWDILLCFSSQHSHSLGLGKPLFPILKSLTSTSDQILTRWLCLQWRYQKGAYLSFQHHKLTYIYHILI